MSKYTIEDFVNQSCQQDRGKGLVKLETPRMNVSFKTFWGRGGWESIRIEFSGKRFAVMQPYEEVTFQVT